MCCSFIGSVPRCLRGPGQSCELGTLSSWASWAAGNHTPEPPRVHMMWKLASGSTRYSTHGTQVPSGSWTYAKHCRQHGWQPWNLLVAPPCPVPRMGWVPPFSLLGPHSNPSGRLETGGGCTGVLRPQLPVFWPLRPPGQRRCPLWSLSQACHFSPRPEELPAMADPEVLHQTLASGLPSP